MYIDFKYEMHKLKKIVQKYTLNNLNKISETLGKPQLIEIKTTFS